MIQISLNPSVTTDFICSQEGAALVLTQSPDELDDLLKCVHNEERAFWQKNRHIIYMPIPRTKFEEAKELIEEQRASLIDPFYAATVSPVAIKEHESANGFVLFPTTAHCNIMTFSLFHELESLLASTKFWTKQEWHEAMSDTCCTDWHKMDEQGESYGGAYPEDKGSFAYDNAWDVCFYRNRASLGKLPFAKDALLKTIQVGCANRQECVRYSNFICSWVQRKQTAMNAAKRTFDDCLAATLFADKSLHYLVKMVKSYYGWGARRSP